MRIASGLSRPYVREYGKFDVKCYADSMSAKQTRRSVCKRQVGASGVIASAKRVTQLAVLTAIALTIFVLELQIPPIVPIPGVKLGLANIITVFAIYRYRAKDVMTVVFIRIFLGSVFGGGMTAFIYSLAGGTLCLIGMLPLHKILPQKLIWLCSVIGAVLHNVGQMCVALAVMGTAILPYFSILIVSGMITGFFTGLCAQIFVHKFNKILPLGGR